MAQPVDDTEDFEDLFEHMQGKPQRFIEPGQPIRGTVLHVGEGSAVLDLGGRLEGLMDLAGLIGPDGKPTIRVGDRVDGFALRVRNRIVEVGRTIGKGMVSKHMIEEARETGVPVEGVVTGVNKGGYEVDISGTAAFCPLGQMDVRRIEDTATMIGQKLAFRVTEIRGGKDVVLSRKALLEQEAARKSQETRKRLEVGARFEGVVTAVRDFGAFVDIGGIEGLVPASELAYGRVRVQDVVQPGQEVEVEVIRIEAGKDGAKERIGLSMRALAQDPFEALAPHLAVGTVIRGIVTRVEMFGAFVELLPGVEGLIHVSAFGKRIGRPSDVVQPSQDIAVRVDGVDAQARRISLAFLDPSDLQSKLAPAVSGEAAPRGARILGIFVAPEAPAPVSAEREAAAPSVPRTILPPPSVGAAQDVTVDRVESYGVFVRWEGGRGLVPGGDLGLPFGTDLRRAMPIGTTFRAVVVEVRPDGKVRLSKTAAQDADERAEAANWQATQVQAKPQGPMGSFGELLMKKLKDPARK